MASVKQRVKHLFRRRGRVRVPREPGWPGLPEGGVREPRKPKGAPPEDSISLSEPR